MTKNNILNQIYDAYKYALNDATDMWLSEYCCSKKEKENRYKEDKEDLEYFKGLLKEINSEWEAVEDIAK